MGSKVQGRLGAGVWSHGRHSRLGKLLEIVAPDNYLKEQYTVILHKKDTISPNDVDQICFEFFQKQKICLEGISVSF